MRVLPTETLTDSQHQKGTAGYILYPMRMRDFSRFGFTDVLNLPGVADE